MISINALVSKAKKMVGLKKSAKKKSKRKKSKSRKRK
jgi:hypothetical protein